MQFSTSTLLAVAASLLVKDVVAAVAPHNHHLQHNHRRNQHTVTDDELVTVTDIVWVTVDWPPVSTSSIESTTTTSVHTTLTSSIVVYSSTSSSAPVSSSSPSPSTSSASSVYVAPAPVKSSSSSTPVAVISSSPKVNVEYVAPTTHSVAHTTLQTIVVPSSAPAVHTTSAAPVVAVTTSSAAPVATKSSSSGSSFQAGVPYNSASLADVFVGTNVKWAYNWQSTSDGLTSNLEFVPMLWCPTSTFTSSWTEDADAAIASGSTYLLGFNEPDLAAQCGISYSDAVSGWLQYMQPYAGKAKLVAPAVTNGGAPMGTSYLQNFIEACESAGCTVDAVAIHWYDSATNIDYFKSHIQDAYTAGGNRPIWITEMGATGSDEEIMTFLSTVIPWMESSGMVERYAYFMASDGILLSGSALSSIGSAYISA